MEIFSKSAEKKFISGVRHAIKKEQSDIEKQKLQEMRLEQTRQEILKDNPDYEKIIEINDKVDFYKNEINICLQEIKNIKENLNLQYELLTKLANDIKSDVNITQRQEELLKIKNDPKKLMQLDNRQQEEFKYWVPENIPQHTNVNLILSTIKQLQNKIINI